ncbi:glutathione synthase/RimK-type ligase-like ATP-grasp enzyme [Tumebacillus sp. BK434]|uniref:YheC/YheD family endospore coat-associated protein n=1 Tax=Tumebacillus sp. BK434 TaxID=2512169 RepID=UPI0010F3828A|nr:YheC/YheD family protein [Tumebacillus sp. BK434]TCP58937.1 glutathione synthase/RimK-type ligase-like ATP-grasp enzyme [Tumebacillus sp. BK434]
MASSKAIRIAPSSLAHSGVLALPRGYLKELSLQPGDLQLFFGAKQARIQLRPSEKGAADTAYVSADLLRELHLPTGGKLTLHKTGAGLRFGWLLGILANVKTEHGQPTGQQKQVFKNLLNAAAGENLYAYVFSAADIDWAEATVTGYHLEGKAGWAWRKLPLPDVVYDQIISRAYSNRPDVAEARERLKSLLGKRFFNPGYFNKWQVHQWLQSDRRMLEHVPDAICFESVAQAAPFLYQHPDVYVKPVHGSLGIGIIRARRRPDGRMFYQIKTKDGSLRQQYAGSVSVFLKKFEKRLKKGPYLIQRTLRLKSWQGRPFDIRILLQKDGAGVWNRTKMFCRIAQQGQITSNLSTGGDALAVKQLLHEMYDDTKVRRIMKQLKDISSAVPQVIEQQNGGTVGELGLDLGLDENGNIWVIEVNAKPWKKPNIEEGEWRDLALLAFVRPVQFAKYLCESDLR